MHMHVLAGRDGGGREADDLALAPHGLAAGDGAHSDLVASRHTLRRHDIVAQQCAGQQSSASNDHVVVGVQANDGRRGHGGFLGMSSYQCEREAVLSGKPDDAAIFAEPDQWGFVDVSVIQADRLCTEQRRATWLRFNQPNRATRSQT
jgi:hypothetical protein